MGIVEGFHTFATLLFIGGSAVVAARLLALAWRTRQEPEALLGGAILCTAVLGYGVLIASLVVRGEQPPETLPAFAVLLGGAGRTLHNAGVTLFLLFVLRVFRRDAPWARALATGMAALLWGGLLAGALGGGLRFELDAVGTPAWWCEYAVIWTYPLWSGAEAYRYWRAMRRRVALGLAEPAVANRLWLWGTSSVFTALATWTASIPFAFAGDPATVLAITPAVRIATAVAGLLSVTCSLFAFLPPAWYRRRIERGLRPAGAATSR